MREQMQAGRFFEELDRYFVRALGEHGATPRGVDWNSREAQEVRFEQLLRLCDRSRPFSLIDYGCGYGALAHYMRRDGYAFRYSGFDISASMLEQARALDGRDPGWRFTDSEDELEPADYVLASGLLNLRLDVSDEQWLEYAAATIASLDRLSRRGFAFNMLSTYSDPELRRPDLYYGDPCRFFDHCKQRFSRDVALLHDYGLYEFTLLVRKEPS